MACWSVSFTESINCRFNGKYYLKGRGEKGGRKRGRKKKREGGKERDRKATLTCTCTHLRVHHIYTNEHVQTHSHPQNIL